MDIMINMPSGIIFTKAISYSGMAMYKECPRKWKFCYIDGFRRKDNKYTLRGKDKHDKLERFFKKERPFPTGDKDLRPWRDLMTTIAKFNPIAEGEIAVDVWWRPAPYDRETAYAYGKRDLVWYEPGITHQYDWKTGKIYDDHIHQAEFYAALSGDDDLIETTFAYLDQPLTTVKYEHTRNDVEEIRDRLDDDIMKIKFDVEWRPNPSNKCVWCEHNWRLGGRCEAAP